MRILRSIRRSIATVIERLPHARLARLKSLQMCAEARTFRHEFAERVRLRRQIVEMCG
jgi:hypothetical protein